MRFPRRSGILLHPTSLPGRFGIGDLGDAAYRFVDFLAAAGQSYWQVLPLSPTGVTSRKRTWRTYPPSLTSGWISGR